MSRSPLDRVEAMRRQARTAPAGDRIGVDLSAWPVPLVRCRSGHTVPADKAFAATEPNGQRFYACVGACRRLWIDGHPELRGLQNAAVVVAEDARQAQRQLELGIGATADPGAGVFD